MINLILELIVHVPSHCSLNFNCRSFFMGLFHHIASNVHRSSFREFNIFNLSNILAWELLLLKCLYSAGEKDTAQSAKLLNPVWLQSLAAAVFRCLAPSLQHASAQQQQMTHLSTKSKLYIMYLLRS